MHVESAHLGDVPLTTVPDSVLVVLVWTLMLHDGPLYRGRAYRDTNRDPHTCRRACRISCYLSTGAHAVVRGNARAGLTRLRWPDDGHRAVLLKLDDVQVEVALADAIDDDRCRRGFRCLCRLTQR